MISIPEYHKLLDDTSADDFRSDPLPGRAGPATLFGAPVTALDMLASFDGWAVAAVPFDGTASSRPGAAAGPRAIRNASLVFANSLRSLGEHTMLDTRTGRQFRYRAPLLVDAGDLHVYPTDPQRMFQAVASESRRLLGCARRAVFLNGDHSTTFPTFAGFRSAQHDRAEGRTLGFINIDHHFDFGNWSVLHGPLYHGSNSRRISELPGMRPENIAFVGVGDVTRYDQYRDLLDAGFHVVPGIQIVREGAARALEQVVEELGSRCDAVYISLDIDVLDTSSASGTGHVTMGGIQVGQLFDIYEALRPLPVTVLDVAEVAPRYDSTGRTEQIAARLLFEFLFRTEICDPHLPPWQTDADHLDLGS